VSWWEREEKTEELVKSGRAALAELHTAASRLSVFVEQLEGLVAEERQRRQQEKGQADA